MAVVYIIVLMMLGAIAWLYEKVGATGLFMLISVLASFQVMKDIYHGEIDWLCFVVALPAFLMLIGVVAMIIYEATHKPK